MEAIDDCSKHGREWTDYKIQGCGFGEEAGARSQDAGGGAFEVLPWVYVLRAAMSGVRLQSGHSLISATFTF